MCVSLVLECVIEKNVDYYGDDIMVPASTTYSSSDTYPYTVIGRVGAFRTRSTHHERKCCKLCREHDECVAWTMEIKAQGFWADPRCYMKRGFGTRRENRRRRVSGYSGKTSFAEFLRAFHFHVQLLSTNG